MKKLCILALLVLMAGCSTASPTLTPFQSRAIESKELEGSFDDVFKATLAVLQDKQYDIKTSDYEGGIIYAESGIYPPSHPSVLAKLAITYLSKDDYQFRMKTTITFEKVTDKITKMRLTIYKLFLGTNNGFDVNKGTGIVQEPKVYQDWYDAIQTEVSRRAQLNK